MVKDGSAVEFSAWALVYLKSLSVCV